MSHIDVKQHGANQDADARGGFRVLWFMVLGPKILWFMVFGIKFLWFMVTNYLQKIYGLWFLGTNLWKNGTVSYFHR